MKITDLKTYIVGTPQLHWGGQFWVFVKLTTDTGIEGIGEAYAIPFHIERLWRRVYSSGYTQRPDIFMMAVLSALEMACWDIMGKETNKPVYELLGGRVHEKLRSYTYLYPKEDDSTDVYMDPDLAAERAAENVALGFTGVKFDPVGPYSAFDPRQPELRPSSRRLV